MKLRDAAIAALVALAAASAVSLTPGGRLAGLSLDSLFWLRHHFVGESDAGPSPAVVVAIDEETYRRPPFKDLPDVMWSRQLAEVLNAVIDGGAKVVGFDVIYPASVEAQISGFERDFLVALRRAARHGKVVLGKIQHQVKPIHPHAAQSFAVGNERNIRSVNVFADDDGVIRRVPLSFAAESAGGGARRETSMAAELANRAGLDPPVPDTAGQLLLNFTGGAESIPTYSLADLTACAEAGKTDYFARNFAGKTVIVGAVLDVEDRRLTSKRFVTGPEGEAYATRCVHPVMTGLFRSDVTRDTIPGVYIHATAVNNLLRGDALRRLGGTAEWAIALALTLAAGFLAFAVAPAGAFAATLGLLVLWTAAATFAFARGLALPLLDPAVGAAAAFAILLAYRVAIADKDKRYIRNLFSYYLAPQVIERMVSQESLPELGGEEREVTILFSDIAGFSAISERLDAVEVGGFLNRYLTEMSELVERHGGFIEKFVADEITGVFGAPLDDPDHAVHAVAAALESRALLSELAGRVGLPEGARLAARFGINSGEMLVGNFGSFRRFTYAAMGDAANLGSRLEGANKFYGTDILVGERTRELTADRVVYREIDRVRVMGRDTPVTIFTPLGLAGTVPAEATAAAELYAAALALYRQGDFEAAAAAFANRAADDPAAKAMAERARAFAAAPPPAEWGGVTDLPSK